MNICLQETHQINFFWVTCAFLRHGNYVGKWDTQGKAFQRPMFTTSTLVLYGSCTKRTAYAG